MKKNGIHVAILGALGTLDFALDIIKDNAVGLLFIAGAIALYLHGMSSDKSEESEELKRERMRFRHEMLRDIMDYLPLLLIMLLPLILIGFAAWSSTMKN